MTTHSARHPARATVAVIALALGALLAVFFVTQVVRGDRYRTISNATVEAHSESE